MVNSKSPKAISVKISLPIANGKTYIEKFGDGITIPLAGTWTEEGCHKLVGDRYPEAYSYEILYKFEENQSHNW